VSSQGSPDAALLTLLVVTFFGAANGAHSPPDESVLYINDICAATFPRLRLLPYRTSPRPANRIVSFADWAAPNPGGPDWQEGGFGRATFIAGAGAASTSSTRRGTKLAAAAASVHGSGTRPCFAFGRR